MITFLSIAAFIIAIVTMLSFATAVATIIFLDYPVDTNPWRTKAFAIAAAVWAAIVIPFAWYGMV